MDTITILQIITISVSVASVIVNSIITLNENRKSNFISVTANQWKEMFAENRVILSKFISMSSPESINEIRTSGSSTYKQELRYLCTRMMYYWKVYYDEEAELIESMLTLLYAAYDYYDNGGDHELGIVKKALQDFYRLSAIYDSADWRLIQAQASGHDIGNDGFEKVYEKGKKQFAKYHTSTFFDRKL